MKMNILGNTCAQKFINVLTISDSANQREEKNGENRVTKKGWKSERQVNEPRGNWYRNSCSNKTKKKHETQREKNGIKNYKLLCKLINWNRSYVYGKQQARN